MDTLERDEELSKKSPLWELCPEMVDGLLRSRGRAHRAKPSADLPVILPEGEQYTNLLIFHIHESLFHAGATTTLSELCHAVLILHARRNVRHVLRDCMVCRRHKAKPYLTASSALLSWRLGERPPFSAIGIDFAGPFQLQNEKGYILLVTCAVTRAVHLEVTLDQSCQSVLNALTRLVARRGPVHVIVSDNAKAFRRAKQEMENLVKWFFIPERSPWWGGFWERMVQNVKKALKHGLGRTKLNFEEFRTVIPEIEYVINRRPLTYLSLAPDDPLPIRPVDFLITPGAGGEPEDDLITATPNSIVKRFRHRQRVLEMVWDRFRDEYLVSLQRWKKFSMGGKVPKVGEVVLVDPQKVKNRAFFPLGIIVELIVGVDGHVRAAYVKTGHLILRRSTTMLYPLELDENLETDTDVGPAQNSDSDLDNGAYENLDNEPTQNPDLDTPNETVNQLDDDPDQDTGSVGRPLDDGGSDSVSTEVNDAGAENTVRSRAGREIRKPSRYAD